MASIKSVTPIGNILRKFLHEHEMHARARQEQIRLSWREIVGDVIAQVSSVQRIAQGVAFVSCSTPVWAQTLSFRRKEILAKIEEHAGKGVIREIRFNCLPYAGAATEQAWRHNGRPGSLKQAPQRLTDKQEQTIAAIAASLTEKSTQQAPSSRGS
jgi:predicted nucleic acid-binding Zn ribbon protein